MTLAWTLSSHILNRARMSCPHDYRCLLRCDSVNPNQTFDAQRLVCARVKDRHGAVAYAFQARLLTPHPMVRGCFHDRIVSP